MTAPPPKLVNDESPTDLELVGAVLDVRLRQTLRALRASLEALTRGPDAGPDSGILRGVLAQVVDVGHSVDDLLELVQPPSANPIRCSVEEVVEGALSELDTKTRASVLLAVEPRRGGLFVDGPLLSRCLSYLIRDGLKAGCTEVLLHVRRTTDTTVFVVIHDTPLWTDRTSRSLTRVLASRSADRLGGQLKVHETKNLCAGFVEGIANDALEVAAA